MSIALSAGAAVMLMLCFPGGPSEVPADGKCTLTLNEKELAGSVSGRKGSDPSPLKHIAETQGENQLRASNGAVQVASDHLLGDLEREAMMGPLDPGTMTLDTAFTPEQTIVNGPGGTATIDTNIRVGGGF